MAGPFLAKLQLMLMGFEDEQQIEKFNDALKDLCTNMHIGVVGGMEVIDFSQNKNNESDDKPADKDAHIPTLDSLKKFKKYKN